MVALITSYLFGAEPVHLNDIYNRPNDSTTQYWTRSYVPGRRFGARKPVYVLTSSHTFSAAEEFTYNLKNLKRATIVGETTGGGAHPGEHVALAARFAMFVPTGRAINPITKTNWEGTGVAPDVQAPADRAFDVAYLGALEQVVAAEKDEKLKALLAQLLADRRRAAGTAGTK
jgi:retinol-binding protein 3